MYSLTGIETSPKEMVPEPIECGGIDTPSRLEIAS